MIMNNTDDLALLVNTPVQAKSLVPNLEQIAKHVWLHMNTNKTESMATTQAAISTLSDKPLN